MPAERTCVRVPETVAETRFLSGNSGATMLPAGCIAPLALFSATVCGYGQCR